MNLRFFLFHFLLVLLFSNCNYFLSAQQSSANSRSISLGFGGSNFHLLDEHATFLIFRGTGIAPVIDYNNTLPHAHHFASGAFYYDNLKSNSDNYKTEITGGQFRYAYLRNIRSGNVSAGLSLSSHYFKTDYKFELQNLWAHAIESWYWRHSIDLAFRLKKEWSRSKIELNVFVPIVSNISRPKYSSSGDYDYEKNDWVVKPLGETVFVNQSPGVNSILKYSVSISDRLLINSGYEFSFAHYKSRQLIRFYMNNIRLGLSYII